MSESSSTNGVASPRKQKRVIVIGAGWAGLVAAKTYLEVDPSIDLTIVEAERTVGGTWGADRIYPGLMTDSPAGLFDYSDLPMRDAIGQKDWTEIRADQVYQYLTAYAEKFHLLERLRAGATVVTITRSEDGAGWNVKLENGELLSCDKLIVATGLTSQPNWPNISWEKFNGPVMHFKALGTRHAELTSDKVSRVTVYGGCKSSIDTIVLCTMAGKKVDWVIRDSGNGPGMMAQVRKIFGFHPGILFSRWKNIWTPSIFHAHGLLYNFLQSGKNSFGYWLTRRVWEKLGKFPYTLEPYKTKSPNIEKLYPENRSALFFTASVSGLHQGNNFVEELHKSDGLITVHRASITSLSENTVTLSNGTTHHADAVVFATGWDRGTATLFDPSNAADLGLPIPISLETPESNAYWSELHVNADEEVLQTFPILTLAPPYNRREQTMTPFRLYRHILPSSLAEKRDRSLIFLSLVTSTSTSIYAEISALWGVAWMEDLLPPKAIPESKLEMDKSIALVNAWCTRRYLARGEGRQIASVEIQDCVDLLMQDMGLRVYRKRGLPGLRALKEGFVPIRSQDYKGVVQELLMAARKRMLEN